ncbi:D-glycerate dehydrogenase [Nostoc ellipsosporum NOK]|uniref:2-hydroxyacid dehydrogenase n=1 Tax=Sphingomonas sp. IBVSS2 TaxID=1985172 RepID=UPI000A2D6381|nr:D-glycerate dehydrogenase [Sphingomonas sp. IBVSS2]MDF2385911.1 D-glycerate dehydrogenase [Nostoc ellipsosporum NOK]OSZ66791.1 D-glycerate dehydrogenase [Sphingomonas sp. IBVSS2]
MAHGPRPSRPRVIVTRALPEGIEARMAELFDVVTNAGDTPMSPQALGAAMADCDVLVPTVTDRIDAALLAAAPDRLRLIANYGAGIGHIDLAAARARGITVTNTPGVLTEDTADMAMALILAVPRRLVEGDELVRAGGWTGWAPTSMRGHRIGGKTLGILGMGRIGQAVAMRARAFGLQIHYHNRHRLPQVLEAQLGATWHPELDSMLAAADILTIHTPHTATTGGLIDARRLDLLGPTGWLINTARGEIVDNEAMIAALAQGRIAGAGLDVYVDEPAVDPRLVQLGNVVLLPHLGSATFEGREDMGVKVIANIRVWSDGHRPPDQVLDGWL